MNDAAGTTENGETPDTESTEVAVCMGSSCFSRGNRHNVKVIKEHIERFGLSGRVVLKGHHCEGLCKYGPNITVNGKVFHAVDVSSAGLLLEQNLKTTGTKTQDEQPIADHFH